MTRNPVHLSDAQTRALRQKYADDLCACGHKRYWHYGADGATGACHRFRGCRCGHYEWRGAGKLRLR